MRVYLAGAIEHAPDNGVQWRREIARFLNEELQHTVYDPTLEEFQILTPAESKTFRQDKNTDFPKFHQAIRKIIHHDLETLTRKTDYVICLWDDFVKNGGGTQGELTVAYYYEIPVYLVSEHPIESISSWILGCADAIFPSFHALQEFLAEKYGKKALKSPS